jgi:hypothetical protein
MPGRPIGKDLVAIIESAPLPSTRAYDIELDARCWIPGFLERLWTARHRAGAATGNVRRAIGA